MHELGRSILNCLITYYQVIVLFSTSEYRASFICSLSEKNMLLQPADVFSFINTGKLLESWKLDFSERRGKFRS